MGRMELKGGGDKGTNGWSSGLPLPEGLDFYHINNFEHRTPPFE
jgi:hypothetical protein